MLEDALSYPTSGERSLGRILIGGLLVLFGWLIVPGLIALGYYVRVLDATSRGEADLPPFEDWAGLVVDGLKAFVVSVAYGLVPYFIFIVVAGLFDVGVQAGGGAGGVLAGVGAVVGLVGLVLALAVQYVLPAALTNLGREDRVGAAFDFETLRPVLVSDSYIVAVVLVFVLAVAVAFLIGFVTVISFGLALILLLPLAPFFYFWLYLVGAYMFGTAFGDAVGSDQPSTVA